MKKGLIWLTAVILCFTTALFAYAQRDVVLLNVNGYVEGDTLDQNYQLENAEGRVADPASVYESLGGRTLYFPLYTEIVPEAETYSQPVNTKEVHSSSRLQDFRVRWEADEGENLVAGVSFQTARDNAGERQVYLAVAVKDTMQLEPEDVSMEISIYALNGAAVRTGPTFEADNSLTLTLNFTVDYTEKQEITNGVFMVENPALTFAEGAEKVVLCFEDEVEVSGNMRGERTLFLRLSRWDAVLSDRYPDAELYLFEGSNKTFRRDVEVKLPAEPREGPGGTELAPYLYREENGKLTEIAAASYDPEDQAFRFSERTLGRYVVSAQPLTQTQEKESAGEQADGADDASSAGDDSWAKEKLPPGVEPNPPTGWR